MGSSWATISFASTFAQTPRFITALATYYGTDPASLRYSRTQLTASSVAVVAEEGTVYDSETGHAAEQMSYLAIEGDGTLQATPVLAGPASTSYYEGNALRRSGYVSGNGVFYLLRDHLGSSSVIVNQDGTVAKSEFYYPYGGNRGAAFSTLTTKRFTGQYHEPGLPGGEGLSYYNARWYDAQLGRFVSADIIVPNPGNPQDLNRMAYVRNNPLRFVDPSGHALCIDSGCDLTWQPVSERPLLRTGQVPRSISYIHGEMTRNAQSRIVQVIAISNAVTKVFYLPRYFPVNEEKEQNDEA